MLELIEESFETDKVEIITPKENRLQNADGADFFMKAAQLIKDSEIRMVSRAVDQLEFNRSQAV